MGLQAALRLIYPPQCVACGEPVASDFGLCGPCWRDTGFITGTVCDLCGLPLPGDAEIAHCDDCLAIGRPWERGRAAFLYSDVGRKLVLGLSMRTGRIWRVLPEIGCIVRWRRFWWRGWWSLRCRCIGGGCSCGGITSRRWCRRGWRSWQGWRIVQTCCSACDLPERRRGAIVRRGLATLPVRFGFIPKGFRC